MGNYLYGDPLHHFGHHASVAERMEKGGSLLLQKRQNPQGHSASQENPTRGIDLEGQISSF